MTKFARKRDGCWIDVFEVPKDFPDIDALNRCLPGGGFVVVDDDLQHGARDTSDGFENPQTVNVAPEFKTLTGSQFIALVAGAIGFGRLDALLAKSAAVTALLVKAETVDRYGGNTRTAISYLAAGDQGLTADELESIETAWRAA